MFDIWIGEINATVLILILSLVIVLPVQLLLCFKVRSRMVRLAPVIGFLLLGEICLLMDLAASGWDGLGYIICAIYAAFMMLICGIGWAIWAVISCVKKNR